MMKTTLIEKPLVNNIEQKNDMIVLDLFISERLNCFQGHFDEAPITPGIVQLHWAVLFAEQYLGLEGVVKNVEVLKFQTLILPNISLQLILEKKSSQKFTFKFSDAGDNFSSGRVVLDN